MGMTTEIDLSEALAPYFNARDIIIITLTITVVVSILFTLVTMLLGRRANQSLLATHDLLEERVEQRTEELKISQERFKLAMRGATDGLWDWNYQSQEIYFSPRWMTMLGYDKDELPGNLDTWMMLCHPEEREKTFIQIEECASGLRDNFSIEYRMRHKDGHWVPILSRAYALRDNKSHQVVRFVGTHVDLSERKEMERDLIQAMELAEAANRSKSEFLASMSHEIRTPMNGVIGMLELLLNNELTKRQRDRAVIAQNSAQSLLSLINDILDFSKVEAGKLELEMLDFNPRELLNEVVKTLNFKAAEKDIELLLDVVGISHSMYIGDPSRLRQIMVNLVDNAIKFTEQGEILIEAKILKAEANNYNFVCRVVDTGIGIAQQKLASLFDSFSQVDASTTRKYGGTGLGLAISQRLCHLMQGDIKVTSTEGQGSCFEFNISLLKSNHAKPSVPRVDISKLTILIVDDNKTNRDISKSQLEKWGAKTVQASNGQAALDICHDHSKRIFDAALLDMNMPDMDGVTLAKSLRAITAFDSMKLLILSSALDIVPTEELKSVGIDGCFLKPVTDSELFNALCAVSARLRPYDDTQPIITKSYLSTLSYGPNLSGEEAARFMAAWPANTHILLVEDNEINQMVAQGILQGLGLDCEIASNGLQALDKLQSAPLKRPFNLILMDIEMPELDGYGACERIRRGQAGSDYQSITIIAMTAHAMQGAKEKCLAAGMDDYRSKPINSHTLFTMCKKWLIETTPKKLKVSHSAVPNSIEPKSGFDPAPKGSIQGINWPANLQVFDFSRSTPSILSSPKLYLQVLSIFSSQYQDFEKKLKSCMADNDMEQLQILIHTIKGSSGNVGLYLICDLATQIEDSLSPGGQIEMATLLDLILWVEKSRMDIKHILCANPSMESPAKTSTRELPELSQVIYRRLVDHEYIPQELIDEFARCANKANKSSDSGNIVQALNLLDYKTALELLDKQQWHI